MQLIPKELALIVEEGAVIVTWMGTITLYVFIVLLDMI
jgi:hypothetical protein